MNKNTKITLAELIRRKEQMLESKKKPKTATLYIKSLGGTITIESPTSDLARDAQDMDNGDAYMVYSCVTEPCRKSKELQTAFECVEPMRSILNGQTEIPNNEDRAGYFVKLKDGKIVLCEDFDTPLGIVSATPAIIGDSGEMHWQGKYVTDDFGRIQYHDVTVPAEIDEDGNIVTEEHSETQPILNPDWNPDREYIPRKDRPEWAAVGCSRLACKQDKSNYRAKFVAGKSACHALGMCESYIKRNTSKCKRKCKRIYELHR